LFTLTAGTINIWFAGGKAWHRSSPSLIGWRPVTGLGVFGPMRFAPQRDNGGMETGAVNGYEWLQADHDLRKFLSLCPEAVAGKYLAITAVDSGSFIPSGVDVTRGWKNVGGIAYSPRLEGAADLPKGCCCLDCYGFDEWYLFGTLPELGNLCQGNFFVTEVARENVFPFINSFLRLRPSDPRDQVITDLFWKQIEWMQPESYIADGLHCLIFATRDRALFATARSALEPQPAPS
jgi:hypothetical protein